MNHVAERRWTSALVWTALFLFATYVMAGVQGEITEAHVSLVYLLIILGGSSGGGRGLGFTLAALAFISIDFFFQPPYGRFEISKRPDWMVLIAFMAAALVATQLLARANEKAREASRRADEIDRLAALGAETLSTGSASQALTAIATVVRDTVGTDACEIWVRDGEMKNPELAARAGTGPVSEPPEMRAGAYDPNPRTIIMPLEVHARSVGMLALRHHEPIILDAGARRFLSALAYYAALGLERVRLVAEAERAEALREADRLKDALLASVSHDLRTPLTTIKALAHDIAGDGDDRAATIEQQADRLNRMVADLLDLSRLNAGELPVRAELNAAEDVVGAAIQQVSGAFAGRELRTSIAWSEPVLVGRFDFVHALRILVNLLENAHKYSPRTQPVDIELSRAGNMIEISVADRGPGVPLAERERIFEPFYRPERSTPDAGSAGLGLSIALRLAMAQGGTLTYEDRVGGGSVFTLGLPAVADAAMDALAG
jgi:two-component system, OmpR family, sensor histidine kinase KdpD